jgi:G3E family GTPase
MKRVRVVEAVYCDVPSEILLAVSRFDPQQLVDGDNGHRRHDPIDHGQALSTWGYQTDQLLSLEALNEMVKKRLPGNIYRCKGVVYAAENPGRRAALQVVGRRADVSLDDEWGETRPRTQIVAIGAPGSIDADALTQQFDAYLSSNGMGATA